MGLLRAWAEARVIFKALVGACPRGLGSCGAIDTIDNVLHVNAVGARNVGRYPVGHWKLQLLASRASCAMRAKQ